MPADDEGCPAESVVSSRPALPATIREFQDDIDEIRRGTALSIERRQNAFKAYAIGLPLIPPILTGLAVFLIRRYREREGISSARLK